MAQASLGSSERRCVLIANVYVLAGNEFINHSFHCDLPRFDATRALPILKGQF